MTPEERKEIYEWGEIEREFTQLALFSRYDGWRYRFFMWLAAKARAIREDIKKDAER